MFWVRRRKGALTARVALSKTNPVHAAARQAVEALETRRLFAYTSVPIDNAMPLYTMAGEGNLVLVGQPNHAIGADESVGQVSVVNAQTGQAEAVLANPDPDALDSFGSAVAFLGNGRIAVATIEADGHGKVYVYDGLDDATPLLIEQNDGGQLFGMHVKGLGSDEILISELNQSGVDGSGGVHVYQLGEDLDNPGESEATFVRTINSGLGGGGVGIANDQFGRALAVDGTNILVGAQNGGGNAYVALIDTTDDSIDQTYSEAGNGAFGQVLALSGSSAFIFASDGVRQYSTGGSLTETYNIPNPVIFGTSFDVDGDKLIVGDYGANDGIERVHGAAYIFDLDEGPATFETLDAPDKTTGAFGSFGEHVAALGGGRYAILDVISDELGVPVSTHVHLYPPVVGNTNTAPVAVIGSYGAVDENDSITLDASASNDADEDELTYAWDLDNDGFYDDATGATVVFSRDLPGGYTVGLQVSDGQDTSTDSTVLTFNDVTPTASAGGNQSAVRQQSVAFSGSGGSTSDSIAAYQWDFEYDGSTFTADASGAGASNIYLAAGVYTVALRVTDDDGDSAISTATVTVAAAQLQGGDLYVGGTNSGETIEVRRDTGSGPRVYINGLLVGSFDVIGKVVILGGGGNDDLSVNSNITNGAEIYGGEGADSIAGGGGDDFLFGQAGNDFVSARHGNDIALGGDDNDYMRGGTGRDVLIGGLGSDDVEGNSADDILIAGYTAHDGDLSALDSIRTSWLSASDYSTRVSNLRNGLLDIDNDVFDDSAIDTVRGGAGQDWFLVQTSGSSTDVIEDLKRTELADDIDVI